MPNNSNKTTGKLWESFTIRILRLEDSERGQGLQTAASVLIQWMSAVVRGVCWVVGGQVRGDRDRGKGHQ